MRIHRHHLENVTFRGSPNLGSKISPELILVHYTAGHSAESSIRTLTRPGSGVSAHLVIARDGTITQLVPFNRAAWHAGKSEYNGRPRVNNFSIGIELDNPGWLKKTPTGWKTWFGVDWPSDQVVELQHKHGGKLLGWATFPERQLQGLDLAGQALIAAYPSLVAVAGHDDVAPGRKRDPGPAFPMNRFRSSWFSESVG
jgi:N-acetylmuramoyl-L-alanine amidase